MQQVTKLHYHAVSKILDVYFDNDCCYTLSAELLRTHSPSAEVQGHSPEQKQLVMNKQSVAITHIEPVGHYAVRLTFDDGHNSGLFSWQYLHHLALNQDQLWQDYIHAVQEYSEQKDSVPIKFIP
ncbi:gamma-butyrobetaine hydroxylase-like domain-containing protein [Pseudoalteromonas sp. T1lg65]|uniref:gamma-butyrobetaine hydroxylase-like domain-containing protein n=1 Tax=Pseudoalteromonas sp. T1lg65 TaxID=2077101 RepID=UPI003F79E5E2